MTIENDLRTMSHRLLKEAKRELEQRGAITPAFIVHEKDGTFRKFEMPGKFAELMNSGPAKGAIFGHLRQYIQEHEADGCIFVTDTWMTIANLKAHNLSREEFERIYRERGAEELVKRGVAERIEALCITIQSADFVWTLTQPYGRDERLKLITFGSLDEKKSPQTQFSGRQKMFGDLRPENLS